MNTSPAPDVDRVLDRMGRSAFGYRSFPHTVPGPGGFAPGPAEAPAPTAIVSPPIPLPAPVAAAGPARRVTLAEMFRILSGDAGRADSPGDAESVFPFRRR